MVPVAPSFYFLIPLHLRFTLPRTLNTCLIPLASICALTIDLLIFAGAPKPVKFAGAGQFERTSIFAINLVDAFPTEVGSDLLT